MFSTTIIPTIGRDTLSRSVESVLSQQCPGSYEVIVVNDSGNPLSWAAWQESDIVRVLNTDRKNRSVARNTGAGAARGEYLHFLDDDDWLLPAGLAALHEGAEHDPDASVVFGGTRFVDRNGDHLFDIKHDLPEALAFVVVMSGEVIPLQSALVRRDAFEAVKGFHPWMIGPENLDLIRRMLSHGRSREIDRLISCVERGETGSTTDLALIRRFSREGRELILDERSVFQRLKTSAGAHPYWQGRVAYIYLTSVLWNLRRVKLGSAVKRLGTAGAAFSAARVHWKRGAFWSALLRPFRSPAFQRAEIEASA